MGLEPGVRSQTDRTEPSPKVRRVHRRVREHTQWGKVGGRPQPGPGAARRSGWLAEVAACGALDRWQVAQLCLRSGPHLLHSEEL